MKVQAAVLLATALAASIPTVQAATCSKTVKNVTGVSGNWGPFHNTRNFSYEIIKGGKDRYVHKRGRRIVGTKCKSGTYKTDYYPNGKDACVSSKTVYTTPIKKTISKTKATGVSGNWGPLHNTNNFHYQILSGTKDRFMHKRGRRQVGTKCKKGTYKIDHWSNGKDACLITTYSHQYSCPAGYILR